MRINANRGMYFGRRPHVGAWIETVAMGYSHELSSVAPMWGRGLKRPEHERQGKDLGRPHVGAWIETGSSLRRWQREVVAPMWGRGLKHHQHARRCCFGTSPPCGGVD